MLLVFRLFVFVYVLGTIYSLVLYHISICNFTISFVSPLFMIHTFIISFFFLLQLKDKLHKLLIRNTANIRIGS